MLMGAVNASAPQNTVPLVVPPLSQLKRATESSDSINGASFHNTHGANMQNTHFSKDLSMNKQRAGKTDLRVDVEDDRNQTSESLPHTPTHRTTSVCDSQGPPSGGPLSYALSRKLLFWDWETVFDWEYDCDYASANLPTFVLHDYWDSKLWLHVAEHHAIYQQFCSLCANIGHPNCHTNAWRWIKVFAPMDLL